MARPSATTRASDTTPAPGTTLALSGTILALVVAIGAGVIRSTHGSAGQRHVEGILPTLAIVAALAAPGVLALIGIATRRPVLFGAAGIACFPLIIVSVVAAPIWIAGTLLLVAFARSSATDPPLSAGGALVLVGFAVPIIVGLWILITETASTPITSPAVPRAASTSRGLMRCCASRSS